jgi:predicted Zn-dependent peptidase
VRSETAADAVARILDAVALGVGLSEAEVESARRYLIDVAPLANETSADIVAQASALAAAGVAPDYLTGHLRDLAGISADEATDAFRSTVRPDDLAVAIAGDAATLVPALTTAGLAATVVSL